MKIIAIGTKGKCIPEANVVSGQKGKYFALQHGEEGRGRWQVRIPLASREFPYIETIGILGAPAPGNPKMFFCDVCGRHVSKSISGTGTGDRCPECVSNARYIRLKLDGEYKLIDLGRKDPKDNPVFLLARGDNDGKILVLWSLSPGYRGGASYGVSGKAEIIAKGEEAQGDAGRMGGADCPLVLVSGPCAFKWKRSGRLYGSVAEWEANFDGQEWSIVPSHTCEDEVFNY